MPGQVSFTNFTTDKLPRLPRSPESGQLGMPAAGAFDVNALIETEPPGSVEAVIDQAKAQVAAGLPVIEMQETAATGGIGVKWRPIGELPELLQPATSMRAVVDAPAAPMTPAPDAGRVPRPSPAPPAQPRRPGRGIGRSLRVLYRWRLALWLLVLGLAGYTALTAGSYHYWLEQSRPPDAVVLVADLGHGGLSRIVVTFLDQHLAVTEVDNNDPQRVTVLTVPEVIALPAEQSLVEASLQAILQPGRLDLVMQLVAGQVARPQFTTVLINNVAVLKKNPHAPGLRAPTPQELRQALQKLGGEG